MPSADHNPLPCIMCVTVAKVAYYPQMHFHQCVFCLVYPFCLSVQLKVLKLLLKANADPNARSGQLELPVGELPNTEYFISSEH